MELSLHLQKRNIRSYLHEYTESRVELNEVAFCNSVASGSVESNSSVKKVFVANTDVWLKCKIMNRRMQILRKLSIVRICSVYTHDRCDHGRVICQSFSAVFANQCGRGSLFVWRITRPLSIINYFSSRMTFMIIDIQFYSTFECKGTCNYLWDRVVNYD